MRSAPVRSAKVRTAPDRSAPDGHTREWSQWSPLRGALVPGTAIYVAVKPA